MAEQCTSGVDGNIKLLVAKSRSPCIKSGQHDARDDGPPKENPLARRNQKVEAPPSPKGGVARQVNTASCGCTEPSAATGPVGDFKKDTLP